MTSLSYLLPREGTEDFIELASGIDLIFGVSFRGSKSITSIPIESGRSINDNAVDQPNTIRISGMVSNMVVADGRNPDQPKSTWTLLQDWKRNNYLLTLVTELDVYENLLIQSLSNNENVQTGTTLQFSIALQQVEFVTPEFTEINSEKVNPTGAAANRVEKVDKGVLNATNA